MDEIAAIEEAAKLGREIGVERMRAAVELADRLIAVIVVEEPDPQTVADAFTFLHRMAARIKTEAEPTP